MWKKILFAALVLFLVATFALNNTNNAIGAAEGEIVNLQNQMEDVITRSSDLSLEARDKAYAEIRQEYFDAQTASLVEAAEADEASTEEVAEEITSISTSLEEKEAELKKIQEELESFIANICTAAGVDADASNIAVIGETITTLGRDLDKVKSELAQAESSIKVLEVDEARLTEILKAGRELNAERQSRISPAELKCAIITTDPNWDYVILNAGLDEGVVIGSQLAVMRNGVKICELNVTLVENNRASADIVDDTLLLGEAVQAGDTVVSVRN